MGKTIKELLLQLIPVAIGVYIGILGGNWNEERSHLQNQRMFLENLSKELEFNKKKVVSAYAYHQEIGKNLDSLLQDWDNNSPESLNQPFFKSGGFSMIPAWYGVKIPGLESSVYQSGLISNAFSKMEFETINKISKTYNFQKEYKELTQPVIQRLISTDPETTCLQVFTTIMFITSDIKGLERKMIEGYDHMIEFLKKKSKE